jgi:hypothetical protein
MQSTLQRPPSQAAARSTIPFHVKTSRIAALLLFCAAGLPAYADPLSAYLPLNLEPEMERQIERVLILAEEPVLKRPIPVQLVEAALPAACKRDHELCIKVRRYLDRYGKDYGVSHASISAGIDHGGGNTVVPNARGMQMDSRFDLSGVAYVQPSDYLLATAGVVAYQGRAMPTGSGLSFGASFAQIDIGYRDHWFSPMTDSSMLQGTESQSQPSITLSNWEPLTRLGFQYELFLSRLSESSNILSNGQGTTLTNRGTPKLFGAQFSIEPLSGWSIGVNRLLQYGGAGLPDTPRFLLRDFFKPAGQSQTQGNQQASYVSRFDVPASTPFAVYMQYAGEDNSNGGSYLLGNTATSVGIDFPKLWHHFDLTYEVAEWQNSWYANSVFLDGMTNDRLVIGQWGADNRIFNDQVGARSQMLRVGWDTPFGGYLEERIRSLVNQSYGLYPYRHYYDLTIRYSAPWHDDTVGGEVTAGRDVFGDRFTRLSAFFRYGGGRSTRTYADAADDDDDADAKTEPAGIEIFADLGGNANKVKADLQKDLPVTTSSIKAGLHAAVGARRAVSDNNDLGARVEYDDVDGHALLGFRPIDYRHRFGSHLALDVFAGVARYDLATPAYSVYAGLGGMWRDVLPKWDLGVDFRYAQNVARDHVLASDPPGIRPDSFYKIESVIGYVSRRF